MVTSSFSRTKSSDGGAVTGLVFGGLADYSLGNRFFVQSGFLYGRKGGGLPDAQRNLNKFKYGDLEIPLLFGIDFWDKLNRRLYVAGGPYIGVLPNKSTDYGLKGEIGAIFRYGDGFYVSYSRGMSGYYPLGSGPLGFYEGDNSVISLGVNVLVRWNRTLVKSRQKVKTGDYDDALTLALQDLAQTEKEYNRAVAAQSSAMGMYAEPYVESLKWVGDVWHVKNNHEQALFYYEKASDIYARHPNPNGTDYTRKELEDALIGAYLKTSGYREAERRILNKLATKRQEEQQKRGHWAYVGYLSAYLESYYQLIDLYVKSGQYEKAREHIKTVLHIENYSSLPIISKDSERALRLDKCAGFYGDMSENDMAESLYQQALELFQGKKNRQYLNTVEHLSIFYQNNYDYAKSEILLQRLLESLQEQKNDKEFYLYCLTALGRHLYLMGRMEQTESMLSEAIEMLEGGRGKLSVDIGEYIPYKILLGSVYIERKNFTKSEEVILSAYKDIEKHQANRIKYGTRNNVRLDIAYGNVLEALAALYLTVKQYEKANLFAIENLKVTERRFSKESRFYALALNLLANTEAHLGLYTQAENRFLEAVKIEEKLNTNQPDDKRTPVNSMNYLGRLYHRMGNSATAYNYYSRANKQMLGHLNDNKQYRYLSDNEKELFLSRYKEWIGIHNYLYLTRDTENPSVTSQMYDNALATKGLLFRLNQQVVQKSLTNNDLKEKYKQWQDRKNFLANVYQMSNEEKRQYEVDESKLEREVNQLEKDLVLKSANLTSLTPQTPPNWQAVQRKLKVNEAAVEILRLPEYILAPTGKIKYAALILKPGQLQPVLVIFANGDDMEETYFADYQTGINDISQTQLLKQSYVRFWEAINRHLAGVKKVYYAPDGVYHKFNPVTFINPSTGKYLSEEMELQQVGSTGEITTLGASQYMSQRPKNAFLFGNPAFRLTDQAAPGSQSLQSSLVAYTRDFGKEPLRPLPGTQTEVDNIHRILPQNGFQSVVKYTKSEATEEALKKVDAPCLLFVGTHGFFTEFADDRAERTITGFETRKFKENPLLRSGICLAGAQNTLEGKRATAQKEDGILTAYEASALNLNQTELVVLSACETGLGEVKNGEGVYGLQRAFQTAGARSVLMSLWKVDDAATQELMTAFFENWMRLKDKRAALKAAQNKLRANPKYSHPYYWGAFVLVGE